MRNNERYVPDIATNLCTYYNCKYIHICMTWRANKIKLHEKKLNKYSGKNLKADVRLHTKQKCKFNLENKKRYNAKANNEANKEQTKLKKKLVANGKAASGCQFDFKHLILCQRLLSSNKRRKPIKRASDSWLKRRHTDSVCLPQPWVKFTQASWAKRKISTREY